MFLDKDISNMAWLGLRAQPEFLRIALTIQDGAYIPQSLRWPFGGVSANYVLRKNPNISPSDFFEIT
jgi:hypothetical protein